MQLRHSFTVPASVAETWAAFGDITSVAECFPGAAVTRAEGDDFEGTCKVKLGPISLVYTGSGRFTSRDESAGVFVLEAKGKDKRGNGTAGATISATLTAAGSGTAVEVLSDLQITGKPAQFGRGVIEDVSNKLLQQFVTCLESKLTVPSVPDAEPGISQPGPPAGPGPASADDALDLGSALLPALAKAYWRQALAAVLVALVLRRLLRHR